MNKPIVKENIMSNYDKIMSEIDYSIKELERLKEVIRTDSVQHKIIRWGGLLGSKSMIYRVKLNIRDSFRRVDKLINSHTGCQYFELLQ